MTRLQEAEALRTAGNRAFTSGLHRAAVEAYSHALALKVDDGTFNAVIAANRAAAHSALGEYLLAIVDAGLALGFDPSYARALQAR